ncbi:uncharacterized protein LOC143590643 [Bidens hawaiensis]|uniref:uncharacterized protein LOC143590643 n=1 Tax=Bidens hawaiensis TaxID=980011 RepID=UPI00404B02C6
MCNKQSRAATLEHEFTNTTLSCCGNLDDYCKKLKEIAGKLDDLGQPVSESRLVMQMVRGLLIELDTIGTIINNGCPKWDEAQQMVQKEQQRQAARPIQPSTANRDSLLVATKSFVDGQTSNSNQSPPQSNYKGNNFDPNYRGRGRGQPWRGGGSRNRGRGNGGRFSSFRPMWGQHQYGYLGTPTGQSGFGNSNQAQFSHPVQQQWTPPPTPYPSAPFTPQHQAHMASAQCPPPGFSPPNLNALSPSDIGMALNNIHLNTLDPYWYMDTGASSHITSDVGKITSPLSLSSNTIFVGNGQRLKINGSGNGYYTLPNKTYQLNQIIHSPQVIKDLFSVREFTIDNQVSVEFNPFGFS